MFLSFLQALVARHRLQLLEAILSGTPLAASERGQALRWALSAVCWPWPTCLLGA